MRLPSFLTPILDTEHAKYPDVIADCMSGTEQSKFTGVALMGLLFIASGIIMLFAFIMDSTGKGVPDVLRIGSGSYNYILLSLVNIGMALGIMYRNKGVWSVTMVFVAVIAIGDLMDIFFSGNTKLAVFILYLAVLLYLFTRECRTWYNVI